jgi:alpha-beta hydrolase superfamily lysophospholipase
LLICFLFDVELGEYRNKSRFLYGESMGGAVALLLHRKDPAFWDGAVLVAPMCKVPSSMQIDALNLSFPSHMLCLDLETDQTYSVLMNEQKIRYRRR